MVRTGASHWGLVFTISSGLVHCHHPPGTIGYGRSRTGP